MSFSLNICEGYNGFMRAKNESIARAVICDLELAGVSTIDVLDRDLWLLAGSIKANNRLSLADSIALALSIRMQANLITSDHHEFDSINMQANYPIQFIR